MTKYKIAYIDESPDETREFQNYAKTEFDVIPITPMSSINDLVAQIINTKAEAVIIDFDLTDKDPKIHYKGNKVAEKILEIREGFPVFIFTSFDEQAIQQSDDVNIIYEKRVMGEKDYDEKIKFKERVKKQIDNYKKKIEAKEKRLLELLEARKQKPLKNIEENELIELDNFLEKSLNKSHLIPSDLKSTTNTQRLNSLLEKADSILEKLKKDE